MLLLLFSAAVVFILWRCWFFFRNPPRHVPAGDSMLSPADGYVVYVRRVEAGEVPIAIKKGRRITLAELAIPGETAGSSGFLIGIFMTPFSVHYNRIPLSGVVSSVHSYKPGNNRTMARMIFNLLTGNKVPETGCTYLLTNERTTTVVQTGSGCYAVTQIADIWVSQIVNRLSPGSKVTRGTPFGMIRFGSQTDIFISDQLGYRPVCTPGEYVYAGETVIASRTSS
ncbi:MAG: phosphatidylserine decarboxylase [Bacteroidota bacterium]